MVDSVKIEQLTISKNIELDLNASKKLIEKTRNISQELNIISTESKEMIGALKMVFNILNELKSVIKWMENMLFDLHSLLFYFLVFALSHYMTSFERSKRARFGVFALTFANFTLELFVNGWLVDLFWIKGYERLFFLAICTCLLVYKAITFKDLAQENLETSQKIYDTLIKMKMKMARQYTIMKSARRLDKSNGELHKHYKKKVNDSEVASNRLLIT